LHHAIAAAITDAVAVTVFIVSVCHSPLQKESECSF